MRSLLRLVLLTAVVSALATPGVAAAQSNPFGGLPPAQQDTSTLEAAPSTTADRSDGLARWQEVLIFMAGIALIAGIGFAIVGDARKNAPVTEEERAGAHRSSASGSRKVHDKARVRKKNKAVKAARRHYR